MKNKIFSVFLIILGCFFVIYDILSIVINPGVFLDILKAFSHIWLIPGAFLIFSGIFEIRKGKLFISIWKKWIKITVSVCLFIGITISTVNLIRMNNPKLADESVTPEYVILLGGGMRKDGKLPKSVKYRVETTARYLKEHPQVPVVVSGGKREYQPYPEAPALKQYLIDCGIPENIILVEAKALDTIQNLENSANMLCKYKECSLEEILNSNIVLISSRFHIARAERIAKRMGFKNVYGVGAKVPAFYVLNCYAREILSYLKLDLRILLTGKPNSIL